jgi:hypothetical protein
MGGHICRVEYGCSPGQSCRNSCRSCSVVLLQCGLQREVSRGCINSILCDSACLVYGLHTFFVGPAAVALAERYDRDSRDQGHAARHVRRDACAQRSSPASHSVRRAADQARRTVVVLTNCFAPNRRGTSGLLAAVVRHPGAAHQRRTGSATAPPGLPDRELSATQSSTSPTPPLVRLDG